MNSNPYQATEHEAADEPGAQRIMRWPFLVDFGFFCLHTAQIGLIGFRSGPEGILSDPSLTLINVVIVARLVLIPLANFSAWQRRPSAIKYLKIAAIVTGMQIAIGVYQIAAWLFPELAETGLPIFAEEGLVVNALVIVLSMGTRITYNIIFYYWAIRQARSYLVAE